jgi:hypothetical protein
MAQILPGIANRRISNHKTFFRELLDLISRKNFPEIAIYGLVSFGLLKAGQFIHFFMEVL